MKLCLLLDTSLPGIAVGLADLDQKVNPLLWRAINTDRFSSINFVEEQLQQGLSSGRWNLSDVTHIVVSTGPGSFTGIRVGLAWCYGIMNKRGVKPRILGVSSLESLARREAVARDVAQPVVAIIPSTRRSGYLARACNGVAESSAFKIDQVHEQVAVTDRVVMADGWAELEDSLVQVGCQTLALSSEALLESSLESLVQTAVDRADEFSLELPAPNYCKKSTVEERVEGQVQ